MTDFYVNDPTDPEAPVVLDDYRGLKPGDRVVYTGPVGLAGTFVVEQLIRIFPGTDNYGTVQAILNGGAYEVNADNLEVAP